MTVPIELKDEVFVVDDFYRNPDKVREVASRAEFIDFDEANFPGLESRYAYFTEEHAHRFSEIVGAKINYDPSRWVFGKFRSASSRHRGRTFVHIDRVDWTAVVNLGQEPPEDAGLGIFRHKGLGLDRVPGSDELARLGYSDLTEFDGVVVRPNTWSETHWELLSTIADRYNRCVVFRGGKLFHAIRETYGDRIGNSRLTQNFFFNLEREAR